MNDNTYVKINSRSIDWSGVHLSVVCDGPWGGYAGPQDLPLPSDVPEQPADDPETGPAPFPPDYQMPADETFIDGIKAAWGGSGDWVLGERPREDQPIPPEAASAPAKA